MCRRDGGSATGARGKNKRLSPKENSRRQTGCELQEPGRRHCLTTSQNHSEHRNNPVLPVVHSDDGCLSSVQPVQEDISIMSSPPGVQPPQPKTRPPSEKITQSCKHVELLNSAHVQGSGRPQMTSGVIGVSSARTFTGNGGAADRDVGGGAFRTQTSRSHVHSRFHVLLSGGTYQTHGMRTLRPRLPDDLSQRPRGIQSCKEDVPDINIQSRGLHRFTGIYCGQAASRSDSSQTSGIVSDIIYERIWRLLQVGVTEQLKMFVKTVMETDEEETEKINSDSSSSLISATLLLPSSQPLFCFTALFVSFSIRTLPPFLPFISLPLSLSSSLTPSSPLLPYRSPSDLPLTLHPLSSLD
ncbi:unnamed protein product [Pleuronectes platessa]|uniref:Uncharacterized protein n=1 Tax=Pleuronectes platessa TaxID=8262 RepID=A0A9N7VMP9_PLEPL|nr:unnamed protein product [Pleuronectes platessa]